MDRSKQSCLKTHDQDKSNASNDPMVLAGSLKFPCNRDSHHCWLLSVGVVQQTSRNNPPVPTTETSILMYFGHHRRSRWRYFLDVRPYHITCFWWERSPNGLFEMRVMVEGVRRPRICHYVTMWHLMTSTWKWRQNTARTSRSINKPTIWNPFSHATMFTAVSHPWRWHAVASRLKWREDYDYSSWEHEET